MLNKLKVMLFGGKPDVERRRVARAGKAPKVGAHIARQNMVIKITEAISADLWEWFVLMGWREVSMRTNRRKLTMLPQSTYVTIAGATVSDREAIYKKLIKTHQKPDA
ncbi:MAG TPA: hypothetical protein PL131_08505 [Methylotenera sp.]|nr:hypothetical protein [Methylotenera sp.]HPH05900.1 hypothetical protein [Methylotenera sp.]HPN00681.1 hypothetical protein [Methylotenera sp.]